MARTPLASQISFGDRSRLTREGTLAFENLPKARGDEEEQQLQARMGIRIGLCRPQADYVTTHSLTTSAPQLDSIHHDRLHQCIQTA